MSCPCKGCDERKLLCHGSCERYQQWSKTIAEYNRKISECKTYPTAKYEHQKKYMLIRLGIKGGKRK